MKIGLMCGLALIMCLAAVPADAHHYSFAAAYDGTKFVDLTGTVAKVEWMNPHARFYLDVRDDAGKMTSWAFELGSPIGLMRQGWTRNSVRIGDVVSVQGSMARDGSNLANARTVRLSDGRRLFAGPASE